MGKWKDSSGLGACGRASPRQPENSRLHLKGMGTWEECSLPQRLGGVYGVLGRPPEVKMTTCGGTGPEGVGGSAAELETFVRVQEPGTGKRWQFGQPSHLLGLP